jgi:hypothetical protein
MKTDFENGAQAFAALLETPGQISPADVLNLRRNVFGDGIVSQQEADAVFAMDSAIPAKCAEWNVFFVESLSDYVVQQAEPQGYVSVANGEWLIERISHDGKLDTASEMELLIAVLNKAKSAPERLVRFALYEIGRAVLEGEGPLSQGRVLEKGVIGEAEVELIRRVLYAFGGDAGISISRAEAEFLFDLNDRTVAAQNHPAWRELFVKAVANYLMASASWRAPSRAVALAREEWLADDKPDIASTLKGAFSGFGQMFSGAFLDGLFDDAHSQVEKAWKERNAVEEARMEHAQVIEEHEAQWLVDRLSRDAMVHDNEKALLRFLKEESPEIHPSLKPWFEKAA